MTHATWMKSEKIVIEFKKVVLQMLIVHFVPLLCIYIVRLFAVTGQFFQEIF